MHDLRPPDVQVHGGWRCGREVAAGSRVRFTSKIDGERTRRVFGQTEAYDPRTDSWEAYAPMLTPRHGMGAVTIADAIHVAGGGPMNGGAFQTSIHEVWTG
jgi:hypothetical protein